MIDWLAVLLGFSVGIAVLVIAAALTRRGDVRSMQREPNPEIEAYIAATAYYGRREIERWGKK